NQLFQATIEEVAQVFQELPEIGRLDEALQVKLVDPLAQEYVNILRRQDMKIFAAALQDIEAIGVKRTGRDGDTALQPALNPRLQFGGGVFGESNGQNLVRARVALFDEPGDAFYQHRGLARAGASQHQHGSRGVLDRRPLSRIRDEFVRHRILLCIMRKEGED